MENNNYCVYIHRNIINNKSYIGITKHGKDPNLRWKNGTHYELCPHFDKAIKKYGWDSFEHIVWVNGLSMEDAQRMEFLLIQLFKTDNPKYGYNVNSGGTCHDFKEETLQKIVNVKKKNKMIRDYYNYDQKEKNRIQASIDKYKEKYENGDPHIKICQKCGAYYFKNKRIGGTKYCTHCQKYQKKPPRMVICVDCGKEIIVSSKDHVTCRCDECAIIYRKNYQKEKMREYRKSIID